MGQTVEFSWFSLWSALLVGLEDESSALVNHYWLSLGQPSWLAGKPSDWPGQTLRVLPWFSLLVGLVSLVFGHSLVGLT